MGEIYIRSQTYHMWTTKYPIAYRFMRQKNNSEMDNIRFDTISTDIWVKHQKKLWHNEDQQEIIHVRDNAPNNTFDLLTFDELTDVLCESKIKKTCGPDQINL